MEDLKKLLKELAEDMPQLFRQLKERVQSSSIHFNEILSLEVQYNNCQREWLGGRVSKPDTDLVVNRITQALLLIIDTLQPSDLKAETGEEGQISLHDYHCHTCDRVDQSDRFQQFFAEKRDTKVHFFYLYGMDVQSHSGMFKRIAYDLEGKLRDYLNPGLESGCKSLQVEITLGQCGDPEVYKQNILKDLFAALSVRVNDHEPLTTKNLAWLRQNSPILQGLCENDFVCVFAGVSQWDWDKEITPAVTRWFINEFCNAELPKDSPAYLFFFAIIYEEDDAEIEQEVEAVISQSQHVRALPELNSVKMRDIGAWFSRYRFIAPSAGELKNLRQQHFGDADEFEMENVEIRLKKLIDNYNSKFF